MIIVEFTMDEAHATADTLRELLERNGTQPRPNRSGSTANSRQQGHQCGRYGRVFTSKRRS